MREGVNDGFGGLVTCAALGNGSSMQRWFTVGGPLNLPPGAPTSRPSLPCLPCLRPGQRRAVHPGQEHVNVGNIQSTTS